MSNPSSEEQSRICLRQIGRIENESGNMKEITHVIKRHDDHDNSTHQVNGRYSSFLGNNSIHHQAKFYRL